MINLKYKQGERVEVAVFGNVSMIEVCTVIGTWNWEPGCMMPFWIVRPDRLGADKRIPHFPPGDYEAVITQASFMRPLGSKELFECDFGYRG